MKRLKKLEKLKLMPEKMLKMHELLNFKGGSGSAGSGDCSICSCQCFDHFGAWTGTYCTVSAINEAVRTHCSEGNGGCQCYLPG